MEDLRKLLDDEEAEISPESLAYVLRGLTWALADELRNGVPSVRERRRHMEIVGALVHSSELYSAALVRWMGSHLDRCDLER